MTSQRPIVLSLLALSTLFTVLLAVSIYQYETNDKKINHVWNSNLWALSNLSTEFDRLQTEALNYRRAHDQHSAQSEHLKLRAEIFLSRYDVLRTGASTVALRRIPEYRTTLQAIGELTTELEPYIADGMADKEKLASFSSIMPRLEPLVRGIYMKSYTRTGWLESYKISVLGKWEILGFLSLIGCLLTWTAIVIQLFRQLHASESLLADQARLSQHLADERAILEQMITAASTGMVLYDNTGRRIAVSANIEKITGKSRQQLIGEPHDPQLMTDKSGSSKQLFQKALEGQRTHLFSSSWDDSRFLQIFYNPIVVDGQVRNVMAEVIDLTELDKAHIYAMKRAQELEAVCNSATIPIITIDGDDMIVSWNPAAERLTGWSQSELTGRPLLSLSTHNRESAQSDLHRAKRNALAGQGQVQIEFPIATKNGPPRQWLLTLATTSSTGRNNNFYLLGQDISERQKIQAELVHASKLATLGELATGMAHELNQPLNVIRMAADNMIELLEDDEELEPSYVYGKLQRISAQTVRAASIIDHMRIFGRRSDGGIETIQLTQIAKNAVDLLRHQITLQGIDIEEDYPTDCPPALGNAVQLEQVIINLLANSRDAIQSSLKRQDSEHAIHVGVSRLAPDRVAVVVEDTGGGIPEDVIPRLFEPFFTTKNVGKGLGLGLSISYGIIEELGGTISVENGERGARFTLALRSADTAADAAMPAEHVVAGA
jgi:PAS domain S-box-containing protein